MATAANAPLALTMGDPAGIGGEIALKSWLARGDRTVPPFFLIDSVLRVQALSAALGLAVPIEQITNTSAAIDVWAHALPVLDLGQVPETVPGKADPAAASAILRSIDMAVSLCKSGKASAVVTNPIQKATLYAQGFTFQGHTDYIASLCAEGDKVPHPVMMLAGPDLRVVPVTVHEPLSQVPQSLSTRLIVDTARITAAALESDFGIESPRLAVAGLNPHAGEGGTIGDAETRIIAPAIAQLQSEGIEVAGPLAADSMFHERARARYDAAICMYHDQALIPIKTIAFDTAVNVTLGLPIVRTSPDHGTALDIAGTGKASAEGLIHALNLAQIMAERRSA